MSVSKVNPIVLDQTGVDSVLFDPTVPEISYFKHDVGASNVIILLAALTLIALASLATPYQFYPKATPLLGY